MTTYRGQHFLDFDAPAQPVSLAAQKAACAEVGRRARECSGRLSSVQEVLRTFRAGGSVERAVYEKGRKRLAPIIDALRNYYGFIVDGEGTSSEPYRLRDVKQVPGLACVTSEMKDAYYLLPHWHNKRAARWEMDGYRCVLCRSQDNLQCHHVTYDRLFGEDLSDLMTVCQPCHEKVHAACGLKFPGGIPMQYAHLVGWKGQDAWLLP